MAGAARLLAICSMTYMFAAIAGSSYALMCEGGLMSGAILSGKRRNA
jgi:hypothetical protein